MIISGPCRLAQEWSVETKAPDKRKLLDGRRKALRYEKCTQTILTLVMDVQCGFHAAECMCFFMHAQKTKGVSYSEPYSSNLSTSWFDWQAP